MSPPADRRPPAPGPAPVPADEVFVALADPTRRSILREVAERGPVTATALAGELPITRQAVAKHLGVLREAGLVVADRSGRENRYVADAAPLGDLAAWADRAGRLWDARLRRLRRRLGDRADDRGGTGRQLGGAADRDAER